MTADFQVTVTFTPKDLLSVEKFQAAIPRAMQKVGFHLEGAVKDSITPFTRTGRLRSSIAKQVGSRSVTVGTRVSYARFVEDGTKLHIIRPRNKKALAFRVGGKKVMTQRVMHPGFKGHHYMRNTLRAERTAIVDIIKRELMGVL